MISRFIPGLVSKATSFKEEEKSTSSKTTPGDPEEIEKQRDANVVFFHEYKTLSSAEAKLQCIFANPVLLRMIDVQSFLESIYEAFDQRRFPPEEEQ